ncbi:WD repeat, SAM and U-box domain-containing protein 1 [Perkinsus olseni]|uniref:WD repeat, SAM and U-box domain-containing protein 1 n=1 Tax=Perkinsus olseni TaxID=32597 RepID=A0A7J6MHP0_PEROL|nr:WD repeat, SAM and U-box domain-containing protein 1 [Perkinsus olseni]
MDGDDEALLKELVESFECPITQELMTDPVTLVETGFTYERSALRNAFKRRPKIDPLTNAPLRSQRVVPNRALKSAIETFTHATQHVPSTRKCVTCGSPVDASIDENDGICHSCQELLLDAIPRESGTCVICCTPTQGAELCPSCERAAQEMVEEDSEPKGLPVFSGDGLIGRGPSKAARGPFTNQPWTPRGRWRDAVATPSTAASRNGGILQR